MTNGFPTPTEAALATWATTTGVEPRIKSLQVSGNRAEVVLDYGQYFDDWVYCIEREDGWCVTVDGNGPCVGWEDPEFIQWG